MFKWFKGAPPEVVKPETEDAFFVALIERVLVLDSAIDASPGGLLPLDQLDGLQKELSDIKAAAMRRLTANGLLANANLVPQLFSAIADSRNRLEFMKGKA